MIGILKGMAVTLKYQFSRAITVQYPKERLEIAERSRGWLVLERTNCTGCGICVKACPIEIISVKTSVGEDGKRAVDSWELRMDRCMYCGFCAQACPRGAIVIDNTYEHSVLDRRDIMNITLVEKTRDDAVEPVCIDEAGGEQ